MFCQLNEQDEVPGFNELHKTGVICNLINLTQKDEHTSQCLFSGFSRIKLIEIIDDEKVAFRQARVQVLPEEECETRKTYQSAEKSNPMHIWLRRYGVIDKDSLAEAVEEQEKSQDREHLKKMPIGAKIDLHGLTREEAWSRLDGFIRECSRRNIKKVLIVHGKGNHCENQVSVLSSMVRTFIEVDDRLGAFGHPFYRIYWS